MSINYNRVGATAVPASTDTVLYEVPTGKTAVINLINICNQGGASATYRVAWCPGAIGGVVAADYIAYEETIGANSHISLQLGLTMAAGHSLLVHASSTSVTFIAGGLER